MPSFRVLSILAVAALIIMNTVTVASAQHDWTRQITE
jgi:hypothetical protein